MAKKLFLLLLVLLGAFPAIGQEADEYRMEVGVGAGVMSHLNDANAKLFGQMKPAGGGFVRFTLNPRHAVKVALNYGQTSGNVSGVTNFYPNQPAGTATTTRLTHEWSGGVVDVNAVYELNFWPYGYNKSYLGLRRLVPYLQVGFGFVYGTADKVFAPSIPIGLGLKYKITPRLNLGLEWAMHLTTTDRLDKLADPLGISTSGFKKKDHYGVTFITLSYSLSPVCPTCNKDKR